MAQYFIDQIAKFNARQYFWIYHNYVGKYKKRVLNQDLSYHNDL